MPAFFDLLKRFRKDERGVFGVIFGLIAVVLVALAGCVVDFSYMQTVRSRAQNALDSSALALQAKMSTLTDDQIKSQAQSLLVERLADSKITATVIGVTKNVNAGTLDLNATIAVPTIFVQLVGVRTLNAQLKTEVTQNSSNLEVSLALDLTGSMTELTSGSNPVTKIQALKDATHNIINLLVQDTQPPTAQTYTRMAMAPYSYGVNVSYATNTDGAHTYIGKVRGSPKGTTNITGATWKANPAVSSNVSKIAKKSSFNTQVVVTASSVSGLIAGDWLVMSGLPSGLSVTNNTPYKIQNIVTSAKTFELVGVTVSGTTNLTGVSFNKCLVASCEVTVTSASHGLNQGDQVYITGVNGMTQINNSAMTSPWTVGAVTTSTFVLTGSTGYTYGTYSSGGTAQCLEYGCADLYIPGKSYIYIPSPNCVTERTINPYQYDDTAPGTTSTLTNPVSYMYYPSRVISGWTTRAVTDSDYCVQSPIMPLTDDKSALSSAVDNFNATGSTAGHIGLAWAWYLIS
ncbi:MAG TPA: ubiquitin-activating E1 FCCH domain-containing protein, partial [Gemmataceae bacterium]|nr:ubiquitin-activating E1 FCCH domain-containing protein [Gemmataceae bacterium]